MAVLLELIKLFRRSVNATGDLDVGLLSLGNWFLDILIVSVNEFPRSFNSGVEVFSIHLLLVQVNSPLMEERHDPNRVANGFRIVCDDVSESVRLKRFQRSTEFDTLVIFDVEDIRVEIKHLVRSKERVPLVQKIIPYLDDSVVVIDVSILECKDV